MNCTHCGAYYSPGQRFCTGCGRDILATSTTAQGTANSTVLTDTHALRGDWQAELPVGTLERRAIAAYPSGSSRGRSGRSNWGRLGAGALSILAVLSKLKGLLVLLKFGKFGMTFVTMVVSVAAYAAFFGFPFALGIVLLLLVHEMGHWVVLRVKGVPATAPVFIPFLGALVGMRGRPRSVKDEAEIGIAGPIAGTAAALLTGIAGSLFPAGNTRDLLYALGYAGMLLNLFNLIPVSPLDGGRVVAAISRWAWPIGMGLLLILFVTHPSAILILILLIGGFETVNRFLRRDRYQTVPGYYAIATHERIMLALVFFGLLGVAFSGMELLHAQLLAIRDGNV